MPSFASLFKKKTLFTDSVQSGNKHQLKRWNAQRISELCVWLTRASEASAGLKCHTNQLALVQAVVCISVGVTLFLPRGSSNRL